ncbi:MAG: SAM-dependent methyltransferase [Desulfobacterales bacterium]|nr:SAM-dependent methyltransferase [Desulfobacterales bacterium]
MLINRENKEKLNNIFLKMKLKNNGDDSPKKEAKIEQILAYLEIIHSMVKKYSPKRRIVFVDCGAGNCYLSFLVYFFYKEIEKKNIEIHCVDQNKSLMEKSEKLAIESGFSNMYFHSEDIMDFSIKGNVELVYSLHACDTATDKTLYFGLKSRAKNILSVSCCQHSFKKKLGAHPYSGITKHRVFKDKITYMIGDSLRALLLESNNYIVDIFEFVSSRYTDKNVMIRSKKGSHNKSVAAKKEYVELSQQFNIKPELENYMGGDFAYKKTA